jgi:hypothetical protein
VTVLLLIAVGVVIALVALVALGGLRALTCRMFGHAWGTSPAGDHACSGTRYCTRCFTWPCMDERVRAER